MSSTGSFISIEIHSYSVHAKNYTWTGTIKIFHTALRQITGLRNITETINASKALVICKWFVSFWLVDLLWTSLCMLHSSSPSTLQIKKSRDPLWRYERVVSLGHTKIASLYLPLTSVILSSTFHQKSRIMLQ